MAAEKAESVQQDTTVMTTDLTMLVRWIWWFSVILVVLGGFFLVLYAFLGSPASLVIAVVMLGVFVPASLYGYRAAKRGQPGPALLVVAFCSWSLAMLVAARGHTALPASLPLVLLPLIFALPYVGRRRQLIIAVGAVVVAGGAAALTINPPLLASRLDETTLAVIMVPIIMVSAGLAVFGLWYVGAALRSSLRKTESMNLRLANSERELEEKVEARTSALQDAVSELSDIEEISRAVNVSLDLDDVISAMQSALQRVIHFDNLSVLLLDKSGQRLMVDHAAGVDLTARKHRKLLREGVSAIEENSVFAAVLNRKQPIVISEIREEQLSAMSSSDRLLYEGNPVKSLLICPLEFAGQSIGVLILGRKNEVMTLSPEELSRIQRYIAPLAIVIRNAHLLEEAEFARSEAIQSSQAKSQFLANMSHELRTPLNAIIGFCELIAEEAEEAGDDQYLDDLKKIRNSGRYLLELISGVLDLTRIEAGKLQVSIASIPVGQVLQDIVTASLPLAEKEGNQLELTVEGDLGEMNSDLTKLRQVLVNLIGNACKFTHDGNIEVKARREQRPGGDHLIFEVSDTGIGIAPDQRERIFSAFTQADESTSRRYGGTGLGLTITRQFCELLGGQIEVESEEGKGSNFIVELPAEAPASLQPK
ncbi:MAG: ATP-binding protein [Xanthomonadales bacterium]|nr:ATP-binding protein [Xanthomonadales bacterium]